MYSFILNKGKCEIVFRYEFITNLPINKLKKLLKWLDICDNNRIELECILDIHNYKNKKKFDKLIEKELNKNGN